MSRVRWEAQCDGDSHLLTVKWDRQQDLPSPAVVLESFHSHCYYSFYCPREDINCFMLPKAALLISCDSIYSVGWEWVSLVLAPVRWEKKASHKWSSKAHKHWTVWGIHLAPAKWVKHKLSALHPTSTIVRVRIKYELKAFAQQPSGHNEISIL